MESPAQLPRDNTMETTAKEGIEFLEKTRPDLAEKCKEVQKENTKNGSGDAPEANGNSPVKITRDNTMVTTAEEGKEFLEKQGGVNADAKTRAQEAELNNSTTESEEKTATKRAADEQEEEVDDAKKAKTGEEAEDAAPVESKEDADKEAPEDAAEQKEAATE